MSRVVVVSEDFVFSAVVFVVVISVVIIVVDRGTNQKLKINR